MKGKFGILMVIAANCLTVANARETVSRFFDTSAPFAAEVTYTVCMPMATDDVTYNLSLASEPCKEDTLLGYRYLAQWSLPREDADTVRGFVAYLPGSFYRYGDGRLAEYHAKEDPSPFYRQGGVMRDNQFARLFPFLLEEDLDKMQADSTYNVVVSSSTYAGKPVTKIEATQSLNGLEGLHYELTVDAENHCPLRLTMLYNPGQLGEQEVTAIYRYPSASVADVPQGDDALAAMYPEVFETMRTSNFSVENMKGRAIPSFALLSTTRERYKYQKEDGFAAPTVVAFIDPKVINAPATIAALREGVTMLPKAANILYVFCSNDIDLIEQTAGDILPGETYLISGNSLARDCGVASMPTMLIVDRGGVVRDVKIGHSRSLAQDLAQSLALIK